MRFWRENKQGKYHKKYFSDIPYTIKKCNNDNYYNKTYTANTLYYVSRNYIPKVAGQVCPM